jgi:hypothetical protein
LTDQILSKVFLSHLVGNHSQILHRIDMFRILGEDLPVKPLGLRQTPGLVVADGQIEGLLDGDLGHERGNLIQSFVRYEALAGSNVARNIPGVKVSRHDAAVWHFIGVYSTLDIDRGVPGAAHRRAAAIGGDGNSTFRQAGHRDPVDCGRQTTSYARRRTSE